MAEKIDPDRLVAIADVAEEYGYHQSSLTRLASSGKLPSWYLGGTWITTRDHIESYIKNAKKPGRPKSNQNSSEKRKNRR